MWSMPGKASRSRFYGSEISTSSLHLGGQGWNMVAAGRKFHRMFVRAADG